ncbi:phosphatase PAP2 family protein [Halobacillus sp. K22]|uniref:phosphatase PAP2 family protein n=1 Tax=Halobacillus sp. K22 TaxID=3457431 RepID=UPI003FCC57BA
MLFSNTKISGFFKASLSLLLIGFLFLSGILYVLMELAEGVLHHEKFLIDQMAFGMVREFSSPLFKQASHWITYAGSVAFMVTASLLLAVYLLFFSRFSRWLGIYFIISMGGVSLLTKGLKSMFNRSRPEFLGGYDGSTSSFPSGHASGAMVFYGFLFYLIAISGLNKIWKWLINGLLALITGLIGLSRVYLGVHYFTDISAGFLLGLLWLMICIAAYEITFHLQNGVRAE